MHTLRNMTITLAAVLYASSIARAQWPVYDVKAWVQLKEMYTTAEATRAEIVAAYNLAHQMSLLPSQLYTQWHMSITQWDTLNAGNTYGNTAAWIIAANNGINATRAYFGPTLTTPQYPPADYGSLNKESQQVIASQYATSELNDGLGQSNLAVLGAIRGNERARTRALQQLQQATTSTDPAQHTQMATLQRINVALVMELLEQQEANQIASSTALQQMLSQKQQNDSLKQSFQDAAIYQQSYQNKVVPLTSGFTQTLNGQE